MIKFIKVGISPELFVLMFKTGSKHHFQVLEGLPEDAQIIDFRFENHPTPLYVCTYISELQGTYLKEGDFLSTIPLTSIKFQKKVCS